MTTTEQQKANQNGNRPLGAQAAAAASQKTAPAHAEQVTPSAEDVEDEEDEEAHGSKRVPKKVFIVIGNVHEFKNTREAEKFLNDEQAPSDFRVIKGNELLRRQKVALS